MISQRHCPICQAPAGEGCPHQALAVEARDFVRRCVESCHAQNHWQRLCLQHRSWAGKSGDWTPEQGDFMWLETAFCGKFLKQLHWFGGLDHEWRTEPRRNHGGFWVILWSKDPQRFWWELHDEIERQAALHFTPAPKGR